MQKLRDDLHAARATWPWTSRRRHAAGRQAVPAMRTAWAYLALGAGIFVGMLGGLSVLAVLAVQVWQGRCGRR